MTATRFLRDHAPELGVAGVVLITHIVANATMVYELHRDAFLYLAMGEHLRLWGMDFPPFIAIVARATRAVLGDSVVAIRMGPALAHAAIVLTAGVVARELGGGLKGRLLAALAVATAPLYLRAGVLFQPVVFDQLWWTLALYALLRIGRAAHDGHGELLEGTTAASPGPAAAPRQAAGPRRWWIAFGVVMGLALLTKLTALVLGMAVLAALILSPLRRQLATPWPWAAATLAIALGSPSIVGQIRLGFPVLGQMADLRAVQLERLTPVDFVAGQILEVGPAVLLAWWGAWALLRRTAWQPYRAVAWTAVAAFLIMMALSAKPYYIGPIYPVLIGVGAATAFRQTRELAAAGRRAAASSVDAALFATIAGWGIITFPLGIPVLRPPSMARYAAALGITEAVRSNTGQVLQLPQDYADMLGWEHLVTAVAAAYHALPASEQSRAVVLASNYGEAGSIDYYGPEMGLIKAVAPVGSYWFFGPGDRTGDVVLVVGEEASELAAYFAEVEEVARVRNPWGVPEERDVPLVVGRAPYRTLQELWPGFRGRN